MGEVLRLDTRGAFTRLKNRAAQFFARNFFCASSASRAALEAQALQHKNDVGKLMAEIALLRSQLEDAEIIPATRTGEEYLEMFRQAAEVVRVAQLALLKLGTSKEMLAVFS